MSFVAQRWLWSSRFFKTSIMICLMILFSPLFFGASSFDHPMNFGCVATLPNVSSFETLRYQDFWDKIISCFKSCHFFISFQWCECSNSVEVKSVELKKLSFNSKVIVFGGKYGFCEVLTFRFDWENDFAFKISNFLLMFHPLKTPF